MFRLLAVEGRPLPRAGEGRGEGDAHSVPAFKPGMAGCGKVLAASGQRSSSSRKGHAVKGGPQARAPAFTLDGMTRELG